MNAADKKAAHSRVRGFFIKLICLLSGAGGGYFGIAAVEFHGVAVNLSGVLHAGAGKADLFAVQFASDGRDYVAVLNRSGNVLKRLFERDLTLGGFPCALDFGRDNP